MKIWMNTSRRNCFAQMSLLLVWLIAAQFVTGVVSAAQKSTEANLSKPKKTGRVKFESGSAETRAQRVARLQRECKNLPNAGACLGYGN